MSCSVHVKYTETLLFCFSLSVSTVLLKLRVRNWKAEPFLVPVVCQPAAGENAGSRAGRSHAKHSKLGVVLCSHHISQTLYMQAIYIFVYNLVPGLKWSPSDVR